MPAGPKSDALSRTAQHSARARTTAQSLCAPFFLFFPPSLPAPFVPPSLPPLPLLSSLLPPSLHRVWGCACASMTTCAPRPPPKTHTHFLRPFLSLSLRHSPFPSPVSACLGRHGQQALEPPPSGPARRRRGAAAPLLPPRGGACLEHRMLRRTRGAGAEEEGVGGKARRDRREEERYRSNSVPPTTNPRRVLLPSCKPVLRCAKTFTVAPALFCPSSSCVMHPRNKPFHRPPQPPPSPPSLLASGGGAPATPARCRSRREPPPISAPRRRRRRRRRRGA